MSDSSKYKSGEVTITVDFGYDIHSLTISHRTYMRILKGVSLTLKGQGFYCEGEREQDYWAFNETDPGSLWVYTEEGRDIINDELSASWVYDQGVTSIAHMNRFKSVC